MGVEAARGGKESQDGAQNMGIDSSDGYEPSRALATHRRETGGLTPEQLGLADSLQTRALTLRAASDGELSIREAVALAAVQLGIEPPEEDF